MIENKNQFIQDTARIRELYDRLQVVEKDLNSISKTVTGGDSSSALFNFVDNGDFLYSNEVYDATNYTNDDKVLGAGWVAVPQSSSDAYIISEDTTEVSDPLTGQSIRKTGTSDPHPDPTADGRVVNWNTDNGAVSMTGGFRLAHKLSGRYFYAGNYVICRMQLVNVAGTNPIASGVRVKASIWDNTNERILRGDIPVLNSTKVGSHTSGSVTRQYILEVQMPDGRRFFTDLTTFTNTKNEVQNTLPTTSINSDNYVVVTIPTIVGATRYSLYRRTPSESNTNWYLVDTVPSSSSSISDFGGQSIAWTIPTLDDSNSQYAYAVGFIDNIDLEIPDEGLPYEAIIPLRIPSVFADYSSTGDQYLQIEFVKEDYTDTDNTDVDTDGILIDKVGLSITNGKWTPSARDISKAPAPTIPITPPPSGGGTGSGNGGTGRCVWEHTGILVWSDDGNHREMPASSILEGDRLVAWDGKKFVPSVVKDITRGISVYNYKIYADEFELKCSFGHRLISSKEDFEKGTLVGKLDDRTLTYNNGKLKSSEIIGLESYKSRMNVVTFTLEKGKQNYVANGFISHNLKTPEDF